jgi:hypothetical protein
MIFHRFLLDNGNHSVSTAKGEGADFKENPKQL